MRKNTLTFEEIQAAEKAAEDRRRSRNQGFSKMHERDQGVQLMSNGAIMQWHVNKELFEASNPGQATLVFPPPVPEDGFGLELRCKDCRKKSRYIFNAEEFRKWLRWA